MSEIEVNNQSRTIVMSETFHAACGSPALDDDIFKRCLWVGYGQAAIRLYVCGMDLRVEDLYDLSETMGYKSENLKLEVKYAGSQRPVRSKQRRTETETDRRHP